MNAHSLTHPFELFDSQAQPKPSEQALIQCLAEEKGQAQAPGTSKSEGKAQTAAEVSKGTLPEFGIDHGSDKGENRHWYTGTLNVAEDLAKGAYHELKDHPLHVAESFVVGAATTAVLGAVAPEIAAAAIVGGLAYGGYQVYQHAGKWLHSAEAVYNPSGHSTAEMAEAHKTVQDFGAGATDVAAAVAGGITERYVATAINDALASATDAHAVKTAGVAGGSNSDGGASSSVNTPGDGGASGTALPGTDGGHHAAIVPGSDHGAGGAPKVLTPEELEIEHGIKLNQGIFRAAQQSGDVLEAQKQFYNVRFDKVLEPTRLITLENRGEGELVQAGQWIATRLDGSGNPVFEDGVQNSWPVKAAQILKAYQVDAAQLENSNSLIAPTKTGGPTVHMVKLDQPISFKAAWGEIKGAIGDWLSNYDYDRINGIPGRDYAVVSKTSFHQTYEPVKPSV